VLLGITVLFYDSALAERFSLAGSLPPSPVSLCSLIILSSRSGIGVVRSKKTEGWATDPA
jgi:hypothetical protein